MFIATPAEGVPVCGVRLWCTRTVAEGGSVCGGRLWCTRGMFQSARELAERGEEESEGHENFSICEESCIFADTEIL
jgi:hypothetical protein